MNKTLRLVILVLFAITSVCELARAQAPAATAASTPTPAAIAAQSIRPGLLISDANDDINKEIAIYGNGLKGLTDKDVVFSDKATQPATLEVTVLDNGNDKVLKLRVKINADDENVYHLALKGTEFDNVTLRIKDTESAMVDRAVATAKEAVAKTKALEKQIGALTTEVTTLKNRPTLSVAEVDSRVALQLKPVLQTQETHAKLITAVANATTESQKAVAKLEEQVTDLQGDFGVVVADMTEKKGGFLGFRQKKVARYPDLVAKYQDAIDRVNTADNAQVAGGTASDKK